MSLLDPECSFCRLWRVQGDDTVELTTQAVTYRMLFLETLVRLGEATREKAQLKRDRDILTQQVRELMGLTSGHPELDAQTNAPSEDCFSG